MRVTQKSLKIGIPCNFYIINQPFQSQRRLVVVMLISLTTSFTSILPKIRDFSVCFGHETGYHIHYVVGGKKISYKCSSNCIIICGVLLRVPDTLKNLSLTIAPSVHVMVGKIFIKEKKNPWMNFSTKDDLRRK